MSNAVYTPPHQMELSMPPSSNDGLLRERIARLAREHEHAISPGERLDLRHEIERLQRIIGKAGPTVE